MRKLIYLVIDGAPDRLVDKPTSLEKAFKPGLDSLARKAKGGMVYTIAKGVAPESDAAVLSILGYDPYKDYTGRGPLEALGVGLKIREGYEVAFRANFATIDAKTLRIIDRRCGRDLTSEEARELAKAIDNLELEVYDGYARVIATVGHRAVVVIGSKSHKLSDNIENTDPAYKRHGKLSIAVKNYERKITKCKPLDTTIEAKITAELVNIFTKKVIEILETHPINNERAKKGKLKANAILLRDAGARLPKVENINTKFKRSFASIVEMPVERGIAVLLGMHDEKVPPPTKDKKADYELRLEKTLKLIDKYDVVYVHLKGPDEPAHDGKFEDKVKSIEQIDKYYVQPLINSIDLSKIAILVTSDHTTPWTLRTHTDDPVPFIVVAKNLEPDGLNRFTESECYSKGKLGIIEHGWLLLPKILKIIE
ncbi:MAG TPA: 2,3-bisphosphoglycerate-independent phosphoglycerate mutase [Desulfurococcales archaeon]|nr:2,3-bisphosphoglycerate-independent phosphoglycerate mutase [Desulfurococcales archaeon]